MWFWRCHCQLVFHQVKRPTTCLKSIKRVTWRFTGMVTAFDIDGWTCGPLVGFVGALCVWWTDCKGWSWTWVLLVCGVRWRHLVVVDHERGRGTCGCNFVVCCACENHWRDRRRGRLIDLYWSCYKRERDSSEITLGVDPHYLDSTFLDYGVTRGSENVPDISGHLEKTLTDSSFQKPLSDEAYSRFRKALGKLLWLSQVRHDLKTWMSVLGTQQAKADARHRTSPKGSLEVFVLGHACMFVFAEQGWDHHESGWWRPTEIRSPSLLQRRITCAVPLQQPEGCQWRSCLFWEIFGKVTEPAAASFEFEFMWGRALWVAICVSRECCVWKIGSPSSFCTSWDRWTWRSCDLVGERLQLSIATCEIHGCTATFEAYRDKVALVKRADERGFV